MFHGCEKLAALDLRHFNTSSVENMLDMFYNTSALRTLDGASYRKGTLTLNFAPVTSMIEAGRPYIVKWEDGSDMTNPVFLGVTLSTANNPVVIDNVISGDSR